MTKKVHNRIQHIANIYGKHPENLNEIFDAVKATVNESRAVAGLSWKVSYRNNVGNTHCAPIGKAQNWSSRDPNLPTGYPGFQGRVWVRFTNDSDKSGFGSDPFRNSLTYTGTGGFGGYGGPWEEFASKRYRAPKRFKQLAPEPQIYSWDYKFFLEDFPAFADGVGAEIIAHEEEEDRHAVWAKLNKQYYKRKEYVLTHTKTWQDPEQVTKDEEFLSLLIRKEERRYLIEEV